MAVCHSDKDPLSAIIGGTVRYKGCSCCIKMAAVLKERGMMEFQRLVT